MLQPKLLKKVLAILEDSAIEYMVTGSIVSSIQGEPRTTHDIDILVNIADSSIQTIMSTFRPPDYYVSESAIKDAIQSKFNVQPH